MKIVKGGPTKLPENHRASGTFFDGINTVYTPPEEITWAGFQISSKKKGLPIGYLANAVAWQNDGLEPEDSSNLLVWQSKSGWPLVAPKVVVLRGFFSDIIDDGLRAVANSLNAAGIMVIKDPFNQVSSTGLAPALPITGFEIMDHGHPTTGGDGSIIESSEISVGLIEIDEFIGGNILEIFNGNERESFGFYRTYTTATSMTSTFPGYDEEYPDITTAITTHRTVRDILEDIGSGTGSSSIDTWNNSWTVVLVPNPGPPAFFEIHVKGISIGITPEPRFPVTHTISNGTTASFQWDGLITRSANYFTAWIENCYRYKAVILMVTGTTVADPVEIHTDTMFGKLDQVTIDGINPGNRTAVTSFVDLVGAEWAEIEDVAAGTELEENQLAAIKARIEDFFGVSL